MRTLVRLLVVAAAVASIAVGGVLVATWDADEETAGTTTSAAAAETVEIVRTDLVDTETFPATLRYRDPRTVGALRGGVVTGLADEGSVVRRGDILAEIDGEPMVLLYAGRPAWRRLASGVPDGSDVAQLEQNLKDLGLDPDDEMTIDEDYTAATARIVRDWQDQLGVDDTGTVELGAVAFLPGPARVGAHRVEPGAMVAPGTPLLEVSSPDQVVVLELPADRQELAVGNAEVTVELAGGESVTGRILAIGATARRLQGADEPTVEVTIELADPQAAGDLDEAPVDVELEADRAAGVLAVPVQALLALAEGGYAVEVVGDGPRRLVAVEIGAFADGLVEVQGDVEAGMRVLVPG